MAEPLALDDRVAIEELLSAYAVLLDLDDTDALVELFTEDGEITVYDRAWTGRDRIRSMFTGAPRGMHLGGRSVVTPTEDGARARQQLVFYPADRGEHRLTVYDDELVRVDGRWRFRRRAIQFMHPDGKLRNRP